MRALHGACGGQVECTVGFSARRDSRSAESRVQKTLVANGVAHESCTDAAVVHDSGFAASTSSARATVRRTQNCLTAQFSKRGKRQHCILYAISFSAVGGFTSMLELSQADIFFTSNSSTISTVVFDNRRYSSFCDSRPLWLTVRRVASTDHDAIATITAPHDCSTRNQNEYWSFLSDWRESQR